MEQFTASTHINQWGNGLAIRLNKTVAKAAGLTYGMPVLIAASPGRITIEACAKEPTLDDMLSAYDPSRHGLTVSGAATGSDQ